MSVLWCEGNKTATKINVYIVNIFIFDYHLSRSNNGDTLKHFTTFNVQRSRLLVATYFYILPFYNLYIAPKNS